MGSVALMIEDQVWSTIQQKDFQNEWDELYSNCSWVSAFQSRAFVCNWYHYNQNEFQPLLLTCRKNNKLIGLLALAVPHAGKTNSNVRNNRARIVGAGEYEAEYQTWLALPAESDLFIKAAIAKVFSHFPFHDIMFRYLTSNTPLSWIKEAYWDKKCVAQPYKRPYMEMADPEFMKIFKKRGFKLKLNRLKRLGRLNFRRITDLKQFDPLLEELTVQFDFRQGAMFNKVSYKGRPHKLQFLRELFKENLLHVTILEVENEIISSIIAVKDEEWAHLGGINTHSPFYSQYSPGFIHFILLGEQLLKDQMKVFDLTPGGDTYKERLATSGDIVHDLLITNNKGYHLKRKLRVRLHDRLIKSGIRPMSMELAMKKKIVILKRRLAEFNPKRLLNFLMHFWADNSINFFPIHLNDFSKPTCSIEIRENSLEDLLCYEYERTKKSRWEFLEEAMKKFGSGEQCYTWVQQNKLMGCVWLNFSSMQDNSVQEPFHKGNQLFLNNIYFHSFADISGFLYHVLLKVDIVYQISKVYYQGYLKEIKLFTVSENIDEKFIKRHDDKPVKG